MGSTPQVTHYRPIVPSMTIPVGTTGKTAHGALITSLTSHDVANVNPVVNAPVVDLAASAPEPPVGDTAWPARPATITTYQAPFGRAQDLVLVPGQFLGSETGATGVQRLFDTLGMRVFYAPDGATDFDAPSIASTKGEADGTHVTFSVSTNDGAGTVKRVLVAFHDFDGSWDFVDLAHGGRRHLVRGHDREPRVRPGDRPSSTSCRCSTRSATSPSCPTRPSCTPRSSGPRDGADDHRDDLAGAERAPAGSPARTPRSRSPAPPPRPGARSGRARRPVVVNVAGTTVVNGTVTDGDGNQAVATATVNLDAGAPSISATVVPATWSNGPRRR